MTHDLVEIAGNRMRLHLHPGQLRAWNCPARIVAVLAGTQGGKTSFGPHWLYREIKRRGPGDYIIATPTFPLLELKCLPEFRRLFEDYLALGRYTASPVHKFAFDEAGQKRTFRGESGLDYATNVYFGYAADPDSLESATAKAAWLDEAGQKKFKLGSWEAILRRLSLHLGRVLITTTIYNLGWLKTKIWDAWKRGDASIKVVRFESIQNPMFPLEEFERARRDLPRWKFNMFYRAIFERPAGLIYDVFNEKLHQVPRFAVPEKWPRYVGLDFGGVNTAALFYAKDPQSGRLFLYREYKAGGRTAAEHAKAILQGEPGVPFCVGGSKSEGQWRREFAAGGLPIHAPVIKDVEVGIDRVYGWHKRGELYVLDDLDGYLAEKQTYSRPLDENGEPTEGIEDKDEFHFMDAERYILGYLSQPVKRGAKSYQG